MLKSDEVLEMLSRAIKTANEDNDSKKLAALTTSYAAMLNTRHTEVTTAAFTQGLNDLVEFVKTQDLLKN